MSDFEMLCFGGQGKKGNYTCRLVAEQEQESASQEPGGLASTGVRYGCALALSGDGGDDSRR